MQSALCLLLIFDIVDENPHFPGGNGAMLDWLSKNIHYTSGCASIHGRVVVSFFVEPDGSLSDIELVQKVDPELDNEVLRVVKAMPKRIPESTLKSDIFEAWLGLCSHLG